jgi:hypothetical protein
LEIAYFYLLQFVIGACKQQQMPSQFAKAFGDALNVAKKQKQPISITITRGPSKTKKTGEHACIYAALGHTADGAGGRPIRERNDETRTEASSLHVTKQEYCRLAQFHACMSGTGLPVPAVGPTVLPHVWAMMKNQ